MTSSYGGTLRDDHSQKMTIIDRVEQLYRRWRRFRATEERRRVLEPNLDSDIKVERYSLGLTAEVIIGEPKQFEVTVSPDASFRPQELISNVEEAGMFFIRDFRISNVSGLIGGELDAYVYRNGLKVDWPTMTPANKMVLVGQYTGKKPTGYLLRSVRAELEYMQRLATHLRQAARVAASEKTITKARKRIDDMLMREPVFETARTQDKFTFCIGVTGPAGLCF